MNQNTESGGELTYDCKCEICNLRAELDKVRETCRVVTRLHDQEEKENQALHDELDKVKEELAIEKDIKTRCPCCGGSLFRGNSGHLVCTYLQCDDPTAINKTGETIREYKNRLTTLQASQRELVEAICKSVTMGSDGRLEISDEELFANTKANAAKLMEGK